MKSLTRIGKRKIWLSAVLAFVLGSYVSHAGTTGKIAGRVVDNSTHQALVSVNVVVVGTTLGAGTDVEGYFTIINVPPGNYDVEFRLIGYRPYAVKGVRVTTDHTTKVDALLEESAVT